MGCVEEWMDVSSLPTQGYWGPHDFLLAQTPLPDTVADFWAMVLQYKVSTVVMLSDCSHTDEVFVPALARVGENKTWYFL